MKFNLGSLVATPCALRSLTLANVDPMTLVTRHVTGDWGDLDDDDKLANEVARRSVSNLLGVRAKDWRQAVHSRPCNSSTTRINTGFAA